MKSRTRHKILMPCILALLLISLIPSGATAKIDGITGPTFNLTVKQDYISTAEGGVIFSSGIAGEGSAAPAARQWRHPPEARRPGRKRCARRGCRS